MFFFKSSNSDENKIVSEYKEKVYQYVKEHPELLYKGIPFMTAIYITFPILVFTWNWLPWIWCCYVVYKQIPIENVSFFLELFNFYKTKYKT